MASDDYNYYNCLKNISEYSLLHLYFQVAASGRRMPIARRNELLVKFLKPKIKDLKWKPIKAEIKMMLRIGRSPNENLELRLIELADKAGNHPSTATIPLYNLLIHLQEKYGLDSRLYSETEESIAGVIYMLEEHIVNCFDDIKQIAPVSLLIESPDAPWLVNKINESDYFSAVMYEWNAEQNKAHIQLHPVNV